MKIYRMKSRNKGLFIETKKYCVIIERKEKAERNLYERITGIEIRNR